MSTDNTAACNGSYALQYTVSNDEQQFLAVLFSRDVGWKKTDQAPAALTLARTAGAVVA
jgi:hypothetical protein